MRKRHLLLQSICLLVGSSFLYSQAPQDPSPPSPEEIERELQEAEEEFEEAKEMFNPWYTGPIVTGSAHILPPGRVNLQPYLFVTDNHGKYDEHGHSHSIPDLIQINPVLNLQFGIIKWMSASVNLQGLYNKQSGRQSGNIGDTSAGLNFGLLAEGPYNPAVRISVNETFPTGKYQRLNPNKSAIEATGAGSYQTTFSFNISKVVWWISTHPMDIRLSLNYTIPSNVHVKSFNSYGGGFGTNGTVHPGQSFTGDLGYEYSFTQRWVAALDVVYFYSLKTTFSGNSGVTAAGTKASVGGPFSDQLSLAPAIEYNPNENLGFIAGVWFTVWGRNSTNFISGVFSFSYGF